MAVSRRDPFRHPRQQDIRVTPRGDTTARSLARDIRPDQVTPRRDTARSLAQDIRPDRVIPYRDTAHSPDQVTTVARAGHSRWPAAGRYCVAARLDIRLGRRQAADFAPQLKSPAEPMVRRLPTGGNWIRTSGSARGLVGLRERYLLALSDG